MISLGSLSLHLEEGVVDGGVGGGGGAMVCRRRVVGSSGVVRRGRMVGCSAVVCRGRVVWCSVVGSGMGRVRRPLTVGGAVMAGAVVGLAGVGDVGNVAGVRVVHVVGHGLMSGDSTHLVVVTISYMYLARTEIVNLCTLFIFDGDFENL